MDSIEEFIISTQFGVMKDKKGIGYGYIAMDREEKR
jgi:hypothetical protein